MEGYEYSFTNEVIIAEKMKRASTMVVVAPGKRSFEVMMVRRNKKARFMADAYVFPGGVMEHVDENLPQWKAMIPTLESIPHWQERITGIRELYEETGLLYTTPTLTHPIHQSLVQSYRQRCSEDANQFLALFQAIQHHPTHPTFVTPHITSCTFWDHWITPKSEKWRYDTHFYLILLGEKPTHTLTHQESELQSLLWDTPQHILEEYNQKKKVLYPPTWVTLQKLTRFPTISSLLAYQPTVSPIFPVFQSIGDQKHVILEGDEDHDHYPGEKGARRRLIVDAEGIHDPYKLVARL